MASVKIEEKRLKQLKQQLFGKEEQPLSVTAPHPKSTKSQSTAQTTTISPTSLKTDLIRIAFFSTVAIAIQFILFTLSKQGLISMFR